MEQIDIARPFDAFSQHISIDENQRILFSAPFGSGKTYFLKQYYQSLKKTTNAFWLSPVKYVVSPNEDIFEYIKYDLASQLLDCQVLKEDLPKDIGVIESSYKYIVNNPKDIFKLLFSALENAPGELAGLPDPVTKAVNKTGKFGKEVVETLNKYQEYTKRLKNQSSSTNQILNDYLDKSIEIKGSVFEDDLISQMIRVGLSKVRAQHQQNVLIVDDLDRLDPEHIFRILNILSVHQDLNNGQNKFGFDKIIVVCDIDNINKIYKHNYGEYVDFDGYIEKFYTTNIFDFTNQQAVALYCQSDLTADLSQEARIVLGDYLSYFVEINELTVRSIIKQQIKPAVADRIIINSALFNKKTSHKFIDTHANGYQFEFQFDINGYQSDDFYITSSSLEFFKVVKILINVFGDIQNLSEAIKRGKDRQYHIDLDKEHLLSALKVFVPMQMILSNPRQPEFLTVSLIENQRHPQAGKNIVQASAINIFDINVYINPNWSTDNPYTGQESFYSNNINFLNEKQIIDHIQQSKNAGKIFNMKDLLSALQGTLTLISSHMYLDLLA